MELVKLSTSGAAEGRVDIPRATAAVRELLLALGENPDREGLRDTPDRVARMYRELFAGLGDNPDRHLARTFADTCEEAVIVRDIAVESICEHHLLPFLGKADVAYLPGERVVGLSKLSRTVQLFSRRPQVQERLSTQIADALMSGLGARGVYVRIEAQHLCMRMRGANEKAGKMITTAVRGELKDDREQRAEVLALLSG